MKYFFNCLSEIKEKMQKAKNCILMFDFDGTLSKIAKTPKEAYLEKSTRDLLKKLSKDFHVAIISGRTLSDVKFKVGLSNLIYAGNHGLEWEINGKKSSVKISGQAIKPLKKLSKIFESLAKNYLGILIENKILGLSIHYRNLSSKRATIFLQKLKMNNYFLDREGLLSISKGKKVLEFRPNVAWNKGKFAEFLLKHFDDNFFPVYVGDDITDENVFCALRKGVTIRVGSKQQSGAEYFIKAGEINKLLSWFV